MKKILLILFVLVGLNAYSQNLGYMETFSGVYKDTLSTTAADTSRTFNSTVTTLIALTIEYNNNSLPKFAMANLGGDFGTYRLRTVAGDSTLVLEGNSTLTGGWVRIPFTLGTSLTPVETIRMTWSGTTQVAIRQWRTHFTY